jgi:pimeloyl-ACP methyl ester carboxylesterase
MSPMVGLGGGVGLAVTDEGAGPVAVLIHGWPVTAYHWRHTAPALIEAGMRVIAVELRGLGGTSHGPGPFDKETLAAEVVRLLDRIGVREFAVVGHDWGGTVGYLLAADLPNRVAALVVEEEVLPGIDIAIPEPGRRHYPTWHGPFNRAPGLAEMLVPGREDAYYGGFLSQSAGPNPLPDDAMHAYLAAYREPACLAASVGYYRTRQADIDAVARRMHARLAIPVLTVGGEYGMGRAVADCFADVASRVEHRQVDGAGHYPAEKRPDPLNGQIALFLGHHLGGPGL